VSNEVNITELASGFIDPQVAFDLYIPRPNFQASLNKVAFFTVIPQAAIEIIFNGQVSPDRAELELGRIWNTVWYGVKPDGSADNVFQRNVEIINRSNDTVFYRLLVAETDN
jgi:hypothetical protein